MLQSGLRQYQTLNTDMGATAGETDLRSENQVKKSGVLKLTARYAGASVYSLWWA